MVGASGGTIGPALCHRRWMEEEEEDDDDDDDNSPRGFEFGFEFGFWVGRYRRTMTPFASILDDETMVG